jgi:fumarate hydratase subunit beta
MPDPIHLTLPPSREALAALRSGDEVLLSGPVYTARDSTHARLVESLRATGELPHGLAGQVLFYAGPTPPAAGRPAGAVGPTTAKRMDDATPELLRAGIAATIGKGARSEAVRQACIDNGAVYFAAVGGAAALLARHVVDAEPIAWPELGTEALVRLTVADFPVFVAIDTLGGDLYAEAPAAFRAAAGESAGSTSGPATGREVSR